MVSVENRCRLLGGMILMITEYFKRKDYWCGDLNAWSKVNDDEYCDLQSNKESIYSDYFKSQRDANDRYR